MKNLIILFVLFFLTVIIPAKAQEHISGLNTNAQVKEYSEQNTTFKNNKNIKNSLELPFWDDFSDSNIYPKQSLWQNNYVYINSVLAPEPPSIGVATFDAVNETGVIYTHADYIRPFVADTLTSLPINLDYPLNNSIYLSFYFRPGGIGNAPDAGDSLILEFYAPEEDKWYNAWAIDGMEDADFKFVILPVSDEKFLKNGFKFRFKNIVTLGSSTYPALASNCDFWHIDYVYLNKNRSINDNVFHDIAFTKPLSSLLQDYEAIPWAHYKELISQPIKDKLSVEFYNNDNTLRIIDSLNFTITDLSGNSAKQQYFGGTFTSLSPTTLFQNEFSNHTFTFPSNNEDTCDFNIQAKIVTNTFDSTQNNIINYTQKFRNYYAYDDGSAEAGYGIYGNGTKFGSVAYKFNPVANGNITGVNIYFTQALNNESQNYFWLNVWNIGEDGKPDTVITSLEGQRPEYTDELNKFYYYEFDEALPISESFFIGWTQTTDEMLNVGFDYNNIANENVYYNIAEDWIQSTIKGAIMMRPVFDGTTFKSINKDIAKEKVKTKPNPATEFIKVNFDYNPNRQYTLSIYDIQGIQVYTDNDFTNTDDGINIESLQKGMYFIKIIENSSKVFHSSFLRQ